VLRDEGLLQKTHDLLQEAESCLLQGQSYSVNPMSGPAVVI